MFVDSEQQPKKQMAAVRSFIARKVDIISFSPIVESGWEPVLREAKAAGIPVFLSDRTVDVKDESLWTTFMGSDFLEEGRRSARWLVNYMKTDKPVNIVELQGTIGSAPAIDRKIGFEEILKDHPNYRIIVSESGDFFRSVGKEVMQKILTDLAAKGQKMDVLFAHNDDMAIGAIEAMEAWGIRPGKDVVIVSVDGIRDAFTAMIAGKAQLFRRMQPPAGPAAHEGRQGLHVGQGPARAHNHLGGRLPRRGGAEGPAEQEVLIGAPSASSRAGLRLKSAQKS